MTDKKSIKLGLFLIMILCFLILISGALISLDLSSDKADNNVKIAAPDNYKLDLTITWGGYSTDIGRDICLDSSGNIYITGDTDTFGEGETDVFIVKYDSSGIQQWNATWGGTEYDYGKGIEVDALGNAYIVGTTSSFGVGYGNVFIAKYDNSGVQQWNITWDMGTYTEANEFALDSSGNIYITGSSGLDTFLAKFNSSGVYQWNITSGYYYGYDIVVETSGNIYIVGYDFATNVDAVLVKYNSTGAYQWNRTLGGDESDNGWGVALDNSGNIYITGDYYDTSMNTLNIFVAKFNSSGDQVWNTTWGGNNDEYGYDITLDDTGNIYITGATYSFGVGYGDVFIAKYNNLGVLLWNDTWGGGSHDEGYGIALDYSGNIYITGKYGISAYEAFILRYIPSHPSGKETISLDLFFLIPLGMAITTITIYETILKKKQKKIIY